MKVEMHNHDEDSEADLNRQILNNSVKASNRERLWKTAQTVPQRTTNPGFGYCHLQRHTEH
jgi:hypothetical protein